MKTKSGKEIPEWGLKDKYKLDPRAKAAWIAALISGEYEQTDSLLYFQGKYCCMGVLCKIRGWSNKKMKGQEFPYQVSNELNKTFEARTRYNISIQGGFGILNDDDGYTFADIAEVIDHNL